MDIALSEKEKKIEEAKRKLSEYEFVRFTTTDFHGLQRGRTVIGKSAAGFVEKGINIYTLTMAVGTKNEVPVFETEINQMGNAYLVPDPEAIFPLPWAAGGKFKVCEILGELYLEGQPMEMCPRYVLQKQMSKLNQQGLTILSGFEFEFMVINENGDPLDRDNCLSTFHLAKHEEFLYGMSKNLQLAGVDLEAINFEYAEGQVEATQVPSFAIEAVDKAIFIKSAIKELCQQRGYQATFMTQPFKRALSLSNGSHYNHSLWDLSKKTNMMFDNSTSSKMSATYTHWLAGLIKHGPALTALCCPTVNCYRRLHVPWSPDKCDWGFDDRSATFRVKIGGESSTYLENRLPSGAFNPYLAVAATIAAGLDGIQNKLELPSVKCPEALVLPNTLEEAIQHLQNDTVMVEALGKTFIGWFCKVKMDNEVKPLKNIKMDDGSDANLATERTHYLISMSYYLSVKVYVIYMIYM